MLKKLLSTLICAVAALAIALPIHAAAQATSQGPVNPSGFVIHKGTNLSHWLSQDFGWHKKSEWLTELDILFIAREGFDHVRLPVDEKELWNEDGTKNEAAFSMLRQGIEWCRATHLRVILDMHTLRSHHFNASNEGGHNTLFSDPKAQAHLASLWKDLSACLSDIPNSELAYEVMNEPVAENPEDWNHLVEITMTEIRKTEPDRVIVVGADMWQQPKYFEFLKVPAGDKNIILSFHTYSPMLFTHYMAGWTALKNYTGPINYPGVVATKEGNKQMEELLADPQTQNFAAEANEVWNAERIFKVMEPAVLKAKELGLQLYCGEFGCMPTVPREARLQYYRDIVGVFEANGIAWANWEYKGDLGIYEWHGASFLTGAPDMAMIDALMQK